MTTDRTSGPASSHAPRGLQRRKPAPLALEARIMFDGAAVATAAEALKPAAAEAPVGHVAELGSMLAAAQAATRATAPADGAKAADGSHSATDAAKPAVERATDGLASNATEVLFVDSRVPDYQTIVAAADAGVKVLILDADHDGVQQIADALSGMHDVASISIVSHGDSGLLLLGNTALHAGDMARYQAELSKIGAAMQAGGEILLYGCDVGAGSAGQSFIHSLADATGAVVAASTDSTGHIAHGGNWDLEIATGALASAPVLDVAKLANYDYSLYTTSVSTLAQLKAALATAATDNLDDIITLSGNITFTSALDTITYAASDAHKTTIVGAGYTISGANLAQVLHINSGTGSVELNNLTITNGLVSGNGGDSVNTGGTAGGDALGGGIYNAGTLTITNSVITANKAAGGGGGGGSGPDNTIGSGGAGGGGGGFGLGVGGTGGNFHPGATGNVITASGKVGTAGVGGTGGYNPNQAPNYLAYAGKGGSSGASAASGGIGGQLYSPGDSGGNGGVASNGTISISGGGGGGSYVKAGGKGGDAAGGIYNAGLLTIISSTVSNNIAAGGGGGGGTVAANPTSGAGGDGGNAAGGIYNIGTLRLDTTSTSNMTGNIGAGGKLGNGRPSSGQDGTSSNDRTTTGTVVTNYVSPAVSGASAGQAVNDNATLSPFTGLALSGSTLSMTITLDNAGKGAFTTASLTASGFSTADGGLTYTHADTTASALQSAVRSLVYQATPNRVAVGSTETTTFTVAINDGGASISNNTTTVVATSVNDAPTGVGNLTLTTILEDTSSPAGAAINTLAGLAFADVDVGDTLGGLAIVGNTADATTQGVWQYSTNGSNWYAIGTVSDASALMMSASTQLRFVPVADYNGTPQGLTVRAVDSSFPASYSSAAATQTRVTLNADVNGGSTAVSANTNTIGITVTAVNDVPSFIKGSNQSVLEDAGAHTMTGWATALNKGAANESGQTLNFIVTNNNNALFSAQPSIDANGNLTYTAAANASGTATVAVSLHDSGGTANGGVDTSATQTFTITVTAVNDAPTGVGNLTLPSILEDTTAPPGATISTLTGLAFADVDIGDVLGGLAIVGNTANATTQGVWQYSTTGSNWYAIGTVSDATALMVSVGTQLRFVPVADYNGTPQGLTVRAVDSSYAGFYSSAAATQTRVTLNADVNGGSTAVSANTNTIDITVTAVNDAPTFTKGGNQTVLEDAGSQSISGWATNLSTGPAGESSQSLTFITSNSNNALFSTQPSIDSTGKLTFTAAANANGTATVTVKLQDSGGTSNGGADSTTQTFTITITPVNDAPTGVPTLSGSSTEGQTLSADTSGIADVDGLIGVTFNHQWQMSADGATWTNISGATAASYTLGSAQVGKYVRDRVSFTDNGGTLETLFSAASPAVAGVVPQVDSINRVGAVAVPGSSTSVVYNVTFNVPVTGVDTTDFILTKTSGNAAGSIASVTGSGASWQVTVNDLTGDGDLRLDLKNSGTGIASGSSTPIGGGFTAGQAYTLDRTPPVVSSVSMPNTPLKVGDPQTVTITVGDDGGLPYSLVSGSTVAGYALSNLVRINNTSYTAQFTVTSPGSDFAAASDVPVNLVLSDSVGNHNTAFTTAISQSNDSINGNAPTLISLSNANVQTNAGVNALVGTLTTSDASVGESFTYSLVSGSGDINNSGFSLVGNSLRVNDPANLGAGNYSVRVRTTDSGGNQLEQTFTITVSSYTAPTAVADTANATEAGGVANVTPGVNPSGNVLNNDTSSNTKTVTAIAGGTVGSARAGTYGSLTLNADGTYIYTVNNSNAAVQALRTNADTLTDTFTYTMADNTAATSSTTLTITLHGANDAPQVSAILTTQQVTVNTPVLYTVPVGTFIDVDAGDILTYSASLSGGAALPAWLSFNGLTRTFSGTPPTVGDLSIVVTATDLIGASASRTFTLQVQEPAPQVDSISLAGSAAVAGSATSLVYNVTFDVPVTGVDASDFSLTTTSGNAAGVISAISGSGSSYQVTVNTLTGDGTLRLDLKSSGTGIVSGGSTAIAGGFAAGQEYILDRTAPVVSSVSMPNVPLKVGDTQTVTITVGDDGGSPYSLVSGTVAGYTLSGLTRIDSTTYRAQFSVTPGGADIAASSDLPVSIVLSDSVGNHNTAFTTAISQSNDMISGNTPTAVSLSNASVHVSQGPSALVGILATTDASVADTFTYSLVSGAGSTDNAAFSLVGNALHVNDPTALGDGTYSVRVRTTDSGGNPLEQVFSIIVSSYTAPVAVADTASATEAGGVANGTAGVNPVGNVLANDTGSNSQTVTAITGGTLGAPLAGTYGSLTLNADGSYTYTLNNSSAAVQALGTADTLTDTFTYSMADNTAASSSATLTISIRGANDAPSVATALSTQQGTVSTPLLFVMPAGTFVDVDTADTLSFRATLSGGAALPAWLSFDGATGTFSGTPPTAETLSVVVTAMDRLGASASNVFTLQVSAAPTPSPTAPLPLPDPQVPNNPQPLPPISALPQTPLQTISQTLGQTVAAPGWSANQMIRDASALNGNRAVPPLGGLGSSLFAGPGAWFSGSGGGFSPVNEAYSPLAPTPFGEFQRTHTDSAAGIFSVLMAPNDQPGLIVFSGVDNQSFLPGARLVFSVPADAFAHSEPQPGVVLRATLADGRPLPSWLSFNSTTGLFEGTPPQGFIGELVIKVIAKDSSGRQAEVSFRVQVQSERSSAGVPHGRSGLSEQLRSAAAGGALWASGRS